MSFMDKLKGTARSLGKDPEWLKEQAVAAVNKHRDAIHSGIDKAASAADRATKGKYQHQIAKGVGKAKQGVEKVKDSGKSGPDRSEPPAH